MVLLFYSWLYVSKNEFLIILLQAFTMLGEVGMASKSTKNSKVA